MAKKQSGYFCNCGHARSAHYQRNGFAVSLDEPKHCLICVCPCYEWNALSSGNRNWDNRTVYKNRRDCF